jgi:hypothetical protein
MNLSETAIALGIPATTLVLLGDRRPLAWRFEIGPEAADRLEGAGLEVEFVIRDRCEYHPTGWDPSDQPRSHHECADCEWDLHWRYDRETADRAVAAILGEEEE